MPEYDILCPVHGDGVAFGSMTQALNGELECPNECQAPVTRRFPRGKYAADLSENTFKPWYSEQLTKDGNPVYVKSRAEEAGMMNSMGLQRWEPGMKSASAQDAEARRKEKQKREGR